MDIEIECYIGIFGGFCYMYDGMCCCFFIFLGMMLLKLVYVFFVFYDEVIYRVNICLLYIYVCKF